MTSRPTSASPSPQQPINLLINRLRPILETIPLTRQQIAVQALAAELGVDILQCAAALLHLLQPNLGPQPPRLLAKATGNPPNLKMVRYRLNIGSQHQLTLEQLKKVLVEESGVDKNNISNVSIRGAYTLIDLPDAMPQDIYQHLKTVEINQRQLAIKRIKPRKKHHNNHYRGKNRDHSPETTAASALNRHQQSHI